MKQIILHFVFVLSISTGYSVSAHHGGALELNFEKPMGPVSGVVTKFAFTFPHVQVYFDRTDENGETSSWMVGSRWTPTVLRSHGWSRNTIKPGDEINVTYFPHVSRANVGAIIRLEINGEHLRTNYE